MSKRLHQTAILLLVTIVLSLVDGCQSQRVDICAMCAKAISARTAVALASASGDTTHVCCARCALLYSGRAAREGTIFTGMITRDYDSGDSLDLAVSFFVYGSEIIPCCVPSVIVLSDREAALEIAEHGGVGGEVLDYGGIRAALTLEARAHCEMCSKPASHEAARPCVLLLASGGNRTACCPHCAFMLQGMLAERTPERVEETWCTGDDHSLFRVDGGARFVSGSDLPICCRPMLAACRSVERAEIFVAEHGGRVLTIGEASELIREHASR